MQKLVAVICVIAVLMLSLGVWNSCVAGFCPPLMWAVDVNVLPTFCFGR